MENANKKIKPKILNWKFIRKFILIILLGIILYFSTPIIILIAAISFSQRGDTLVPNDLLIGKEFTISSTSAYIQDDRDKSKLAGSIACINESDESIKDFYSHNSNIIYIPSSMKFTVDKVFITHSFEIGDMKRFLIKDANGFETSIYADPVDSTDLCYGKESSTLKKLFQYAEKNGSVHVNVLLNKHIYDYAGTSMETDTTVSLFKSKLSSLPNSKKYNYSIIKTGDYQFDKDDLVSVEMEADINTLSFLWLFNSDLHIWAVNSLDPEYTQKLTLDEIYSLSVLPCVSSKTERSLCGITILNGHEVFKPKEQNVVGLAMFSLDHGTMSLVDSKGSIVGNVFLQKFGNSDYLFYWTAETVSSQSNVNLKDIKVSPGKYSLRFVSEFSGNQVYESREFTVSDQVDKTLAPESVYVGPTLAPNSQNTSTIESQIVPATLIPNTLMIPIPPSQNTYQGTAP